MVSQARFKKYTADESQPVEVKKARNSKPAKIIFNIFTILLFTGVFVFIIWLAPARSTISGNYTPPSSLNEIQKMSKARWFLHNGQAEILKDCLSWYQVSTGESCDSPEKLASRGYCPFLFTDSEGNEVKILPAGEDLSKNTDNFIFAVESPTDNVSKFVSRKTAKWNNLFGRSRLEPEEEEMVCDPKGDTSVHAQFLPSSSGSYEKYICFLSQIWETSVTAYETLYQKPPSSLRDLLDGVGLKPNPNCKIPANTGGISCEGGIIDGKIVYWMVTLSDGTTRGQARYWDSLAGSYDDPNTPQNIVTESGSLPVVDPFLVKGKRDILFTDKIIASLVKPGNTDKPVNGEKN